MGALPTKTFEVNGSRYRTTLLSAVDGRSLYLRLMKSLAPALGELADVSEKSESAILRVAAKAFESLDTKLFDDLCDAFGSVTFALRTGGEDRLDRDGFESHFAGKYSAMTKWVIELIKLNGMIDFLSEISPPGAARGSVSK